MPSLPVLKIGSSGSYVRLLQMNLNGLALNYNDMPTDGVFDAKTEAVVRNFQDKYMLSDGIVGKATWKLLNQNVEAVQSLLNSRGYPVGNADGWYGPRTTSAVYAFQRNHGLSQSGIVDPRTRQKLFDPYPRDNYESLPTSTNISSLHPYVANLARRFLALTKEHNMDVRITTAFRSWADEDRLYALGRTTPGSIVTNTMGGASYHNWGLAFDAAPFEGGLESTDMQKFAFMGQLGQQVGLHWGGTFRSIKDYPHFQYTFGLDTWDLLNGVRPPR